MSLPPWLEPLFSTEEIRAADRYAIEDAGIESLELMERAGGGLARVAADVAGPGPIRFVLGKGNNGGDGLVAARLLREEGRDVDVLSAYPPDELRGDARRNLELLPGEAPAYAESGLKASALSGSGAAVDCVLGTGFAGAPRGEAAQAIAAINSADVPVVACDVPSGVDAATGRVETQAVSADTTATFHASKLGLHIAPGAWYAGQIQVVDIGIPRDAPTARSAGLITPDVLELIPHRTRRSTKFDSGTVVIAGGSRGLTGAPSMAALSAIRAGAGYVQVAVPGSLEPIFEIRLLEPMTRALPDQDGAHTDGGVEAVAELAQRADAVVLGPGIGRSDGALSFARSVAESVEVPLVLDADGLNAHAGRLDHLRARSAPTVLTPHAGELARLFGKASGEVVANRLDSALTAATTSQATVVLKGDDTLVASPTGVVAVSPGASPALATAGTGDVLSGLIGALCAKGLGAWEAACAGVLAHARAGSLAASRWGADHTVASDVIEFLGAAFAYPDIAGR